VTGGALKMQGLKKVQCHLRAEVLCTILVVKYIKNTCLFLVCFLQFYHPFVHRHLTVFQSKVIPCLLRLRNSHNSAVAESAREALALVGYVDAVSGRGVRVLCLDGGGTKYVPMSNFIDFIVDLLTQ